MKHRTIPLGLFALMLLLSLACSTVTGISRDTVDAKATVAAVVTEAVVLATQEAPLVETAQSYVTELPDLKETAEAAVTENPEIFGTIQAYASEIPDLQETAEAVITDSPEFLETVEAIATQGFDMGEAPDDIPVVDETTILYFYGSETLVSYTTSQDFDTVIEFYKTEMPANGWEADDSKTYQMPNTASLTWNQIDRTATLIVTVNPVNDSTVVAITIQPR